jgi:hypothetical protein
VRADFRLLPLAHHGVRVGRLWCGCSLGRSRERDNHAKHGESFNFQAETMAQPTPCAKTGSIGDELGRPARGTSRAQPAANARPSTCVLDVDAHYGPAEKGDS